MHAKESGHYRIGNEFALKHGHARRDSGHSGTYNAWIDMRRRCNNQRHPAYRFYGARGITVCERWSLFANFLNDMGIKPQGLSLDRKDNDSGYRPGNCRWATAIEQQGNRGNVRHLFFLGETQTIAEWCRILGLLPSTVRERLCRGWTTEEALGKRARKIRSSI